jgi:flagellar motor switch protein FliM
VSTETLSQNEIDRLLGGSGDYPPAAAVAQQDVQIYDFRRPHRVSKERLRTLEAMYERLVKSLEGWLMGRVRGQVELKLLSVEQFSFGEFTLSLPTPCASYLFDIRDSGGAQGVIDFGHDFAYFLVDRLFGGSGGATTMRRSLTPIERLAVRTVAERVMHLTREVWQDYIEMDLALSGFESIPEILRVANREDPVLVANIDVAAGGTRSLLLLMLPFSVLEKFFSASGKRVASVTGSERERAANREATETSLRVTRVPVAARLPDFRITVRDLTALAEGGLLATGIPTDAELRVLIAGQPRFRGTAGRIGRNLAVRLATPLDAPDEAPITTAQDQPPA